jgi:hypothetical protein
MPAAAKHHPAATRQNQIRLMNFIERRIGIGGSKLQLLGHPHMLDPERFGFIEQANQISLRRIVARIENRQRHQCILDLKSQICDCPSSLMFGCPKFIKWLALTSMKLSISTLVCPTWSWPQIVGAASAHGVQGIDPRGLGHEIDVTKLPTFDIELDASMELLHEHGLEMPCLNTSIALVTPAPERWEMMLAECHRYARLAERSGEIPPRFRRLRLKA